MRLFSALPATGGSLSHPLVFAAALLVLVNDVWLRAAFPGWWTGKLSDVGWLVLVPVALAAVLGVRARGLALGLTAAVYTALQLWPPLGAWFNPAHVADAGDLMVLPALLGAVLVWRTPQRTSRGLTVVGATVVAGTLVADSRVWPESISYPCNEAPDWDAAAPLRFTLDDEFAIPVSTDAFVRGLSLVDEAGAEVPIVVTGDAYDGVLVCARDGLRANSIYTWTIGPWEEEASNEVSFTHAGLETVVLLTGEEDGEPAPDRATCAALGEAFPGPPEIVSACDDAHPGAERVQEPASDTGSVP